MPDNTIKAHYDHDDTERSAILENVRQMVSLTKPWILPPQGQSADTKLPENYQSVGSRGTSALEGKMLLALYTPGSPWFQHKLPAKILYASDVPEELKVVLQQQLLMQDLAVVNLLEAQSLQKSRGAVTSFRSRKRIALAQAIHTGDSLERMDDDYRITTFRRDQYVTRRDTAGDVLYHITKEEIDPLALPEDMLMATGLDVSDLRDKQVQDRMECVYTLVSWNPESKKWVITQEVNDQVINESEETITPFFSTAVELSPSEHYGRGIVEQNQGDLKSLDEQERRRGELLEAATFNKVAKDYNCRTPDEDLARETTGNIIHCRVKGGQVDDIALMGFPNVREYNMITDGIRDKTAQLGRAFLLDSAALPEGERVTAEQIRRIASELDSSLGGAYAPIAEQQQMPLLRRARHLAEKQNILPKLPENIEVEAVTGIAALTRNIQLQKELQVSQIFAQFPEKAQNKINWDVMAVQLARLADFYEPGVIKTEDQERRERAQQVQQQLVAQAGEQAIESAGNIAETAAAQAQPE